MGEELAAREDDVICWEKRHRLVGGEEGAAHASPSVAAPVSLSPQEAAIVRRIQRAKLFVFLREQRHVLFSPDFQEELARALYADAPKGQPPIPPAQLALATLLQAYTGVSDDEVIEATTMDRRWQLVLDCLDTHRAAL